MRVLHKSLVALATGFMVLLVGGGSRFAIGLTLKPMAVDLGWLLVCAPCFACGLATGICPNCLRSAAP